MIRYPENIVRTMRPLMQKAVFAAMHHFRRRHDGRGFGPARMWIQETRRIDAASGYSESINLIRGAK